MSEARGFGPARGPIDHGTEGNSGKAGARHAPKKSRTTGTVAAPGGRARQGDDPSVVPLVVPCWRRSDIARGADVPRELEVLRRRKK
jgi:hypothetical protein